MTLSLPDLVASLARPGCAVCGGLAWVCEEHPDRSWETGAANDCRCGAPGQPCTCTHLSGYTGHRGSAGAGGLRPNRAT